MGEIAERLLLEYALLALAPLFRGRRIFEII
jgi:hypothetical protein